MTTTAREDNAMSAAPAAPVDVYLQPHSDDICFSLGALAHRRRRGRLLTVFPIAGYVEQPGAPRDVAAVTRLRIAEDAAFAAACELTHQRVELPCASVLGHHPFDLAWAADNARRCEAALLAALTALDSEGPREGQPWLFAPSGIGGHVDHVAVRIVIVRNLAQLEERYRIGFYEDLHYASDARARREGLRRLFDELPDRALVRHAWPLGAEGESKLALIRLYASQFAETPRSLARFSPATRDDDPPHEALWSEERVGPA